MAVVTTHTGLSLEAIGRRLELVRESLGDTRVPIGGGEYESVQTISAEGSEALDALLRDIDQALIAATAAPASTEGHR